MLTVYDSQGQSLSLGEPVAQGGEAIVYHVPSRASEVAKLYVPRPREGYAEKIPWMATHPPRLPETRRHHLLVAWPTEPLYNQRRQFVGYLMPYVPDAVSLLHVYSPRLRSGTLPHFDLHYRYRTAQHLAYVIGVLHTQGFVLGDLNESNILVRPDSRVTLIDVDSFQIWRQHGGANVLHPCPVGRAEYAAPELQSGALGGAVRQMEHDYFALAVLIFKLLMEGRHPFQSRWSGEGDPLPLEHKIGRGYFPHVEPPRGPVSPPPNTAALETLYPSLSDLVRRTFVDGHTQPVARPSPREWVQALKYAERALCHCRKGHLFSSHLDRCHRCGQGRARFPRWVADAGRRLAPPDAAAVRGLTSTVATAARRGAATAAAVAAPGGSASAGPAAPVTQAPLPVRRERGKRGANESMAALMLGVQGRWVRTVVAGVAALVTAILILLITPLREPALDLVSAPLLLFTLPLAALIGGEVSRRLPAAATAARARRAANQAAVTILFLLLALEVLSFLGRQGSGTAVVFAFGWLALLVTVARLLVARPQFPRWPLWLLAAAALAHPRWRWLVPPVGLFAALTLGADWAARRLERSRGTKGRRMAPGQAATIAWVWAVVTLLLLGAVRMALPASVPALAVAPGGDLDRARVSNVAPLLLNVRDAPAVTAPVQSRLREGTEVSRLEVRTVGESRWVRIRAGAVEGWVSENYLEGPLP